MRIAINAWFLHQPGTGSGQYLHGLLQAMPPEAAEHEFLLLTPPGTPPLRVPGLRVEHRAAGSQSGSASPGSARLWRSNLGKVLFEQIAFPRACRQWGADVAHVPYWGSPLRPSVPTLVTIHDLIPLLLPAYRGGPLVRTYTLLVSAAARRATLVLTDSLASQRDIEVHLGLPPGRLRCIYLAAGERFSPTPDPGDSEIRSRYVLPERYVLYLAGHDVRKNVAGLVEAFATVVQADDDVTLVIGGRLPSQSGPLFFDPQHLVSALGMADNVLFTGWVDEADMPALYRGAACAVFPSRYEGFGLPVLEALACGTPLVASNVASLPELVGDAGFVLDPDDVQGMAGAILACLVDEPLAAELRRRGPEQAARFSWSRTVQQTLAAYGEAAAHGSGFALRSGPASQPSQQGGQQ